MLCDGTQIMGRALLSQNCSCAGEAFLCSLKFPYGFNGALLDIVLLD